MSTRVEWSKRGGVLLALAVLCFASVSSATAQSHKKVKKAAVAQPTLPSGPTGPVQQIPLDSIAAVPPQVSFQNNQLTIVAPNSTLADILRAVKKTTGAEIEVPAAPERVVTRIGPGPAREVIAELLNGSRFNYVLLGAPGDDNSLTRVVLVQKNGSQEIPAPAPQVDPALGIAQPGQPNVAQGQVETPPDSAESEPTDDNQPDDNSGDQNGNEAEQPADGPPGVKTPQQMLQEMQQRQLQLQQQQPPGQPPVPGSGMPPHPPQEN